MTDKELRKLRRSELLEMLIEQKKIAAAEEKRAADEMSLREEKEAQLQELDATYQRLRRKLDDKDQKINELRAALEELSAKVDPDTLAKTSARLNKAVELFEKAAEKIQKK